MRTFRIPLFGGDWGTRTIAGYMKRFAREGQTDPTVRDLALSIVRGVPGRNGLAQAVAIRNWLASNVEFTRDPERAELLYTPARMVSILTTRGPPLYIDCDDVAVLAAALGGSIGLKSRFQLVGFLSPRAPIRHVWTELQSPSGDRRWVQMDVTRSSQSLLLDRAISRRWTVKV